MRSDQQQHGVWFHLLDVLFNIVVIVVIVATIRTFFVSPFEVEGNSMLDTLEDQQYIVINKFAYLVGEPQRGDVVVLRPPSEEGKYYVKRVIGLPGDEITIQNGSVFVKEQGMNEPVKLVEPYLNDRNAHHTYRHPPSSGDTAPIVYNVPPDSYFVLGDNRMGSLDSRSFLSKETSQPQPYVSVDNIKGRVWFIALPVTKIHALEPPEYGF